MIEYGYKNRFVWKPSTTQGIPPIYVDSGWPYVFINEKIQEVLQLSLCDNKKVKLDDGNIAICDLVGPMDLRFGNRFAFLSAFVLPGDAEPVLGKRAIQELDVAIDPQSMQLFVNPDHPDEAIHRLGGFKIIDDL